MANITNFNKITMTSIEIAKLTGKQHGHILRDIEDENAKISDICNDSIFGLVEYTDQKGEKRPMYHLTKKGVLQLGARYDAKVRYKLISTIEELEMKTLKQGETTQYAENIPRIARKDVCVKMFNSHTIHCFDYCGTTYFFADEVIEPMGYIVIDKTIAEFKAEDYTRCFKVECISGRGSYEYNLGISVEGIRYMLNKIKSKNVLVFYKWFLNNFIMNERNDTPQISLPTPDADARKFKHELDELYDIFCVIRSMTNKQEDINSYRTYKGLLVIYKMFDEKFITLCNKARHA